MAAALTASGPTGGGHDGQCRNCGARIVGPFCAQCGQVSHPHRSLAHLVDEFFYGVLHFDTKAWRTVPMVIFRPGRLTRDYVYGKRARYISPFALFLCTIFFMFFVFAFLPDVTTTVVAPDGGVSGSTWQEQARAMARSDNFPVIKGWDGLNEKVRHALENPDLALYRVQQAAYKFSFLLAPLSLPFIALLFLRSRDVTLYDHAVYALYALSFASLLFVAVVLLSRYAWTSEFGWLPILALPVHTYVHLKGAYALRWPSALWRTFFMMVFAAVIALIFLVLIVALGLAS